MKKNFFLSTVMLLSLALLATSCDKKKGIEEKKHEIQTVEFLDAASYDSWVYFNFEKKALVKKAVIAEDMSQDLSWDIAFHRQDIKINCGVSGKGQGGGFESELTELKDLKSVQPNFVVDVMGKVLSKFEVNNGEHSMEYSDSGINPALTGGSKDGKGLGWIDTTHGDRGPKYDINPHIFFVKTANGKTVAIKFTSFKSAELKSGHISFQYLFVD